MSVEERRRRINKIFAATYFFILISFQIIMLYYIFTHGPTLLSIVLFIGINIVLTIVLGLVLIEIFKKIYKEE